MAAIPESGEIVKFAFRLFFRLRAGERYPARQKFNIFDFRRQYGFVMESIMIINFLLITAAVKNNLKPTRAMC